MKPCRLNGRSVDDRRLRELFTVMADPAARTAGGGFLFLAHFSDETAYFGVVPVVVETVRRYHFDIALGTDARPLVTGGFQTDGTVRALCLPTPGDTWSESSLPRARFQLRSLGELLCSHGYRATTPLDWITLKWFQDDRVFGPDVRTVGALRQPVGSGGLAGS